MKARNIIAWIFVLIFIDQTIKILINIYLGNVHFEIIPSLIEFKPTFNERHSWVNTLLNDNFGLNIGLIPHIILYLLAGILVPMYFSYFKNKISDNKKLIESATTLGKELRKNNFDYLDHIKEPIENLKNTPLSKAIAKLLESYKKILICLHDSSVFKSLAEILAEPVPTAPSQTQNSTNSVE